MKVKFNFTTYSYFGEVDSLSTVNGRVYNEGSAANVKGKVLEEGESIKIFDQSELDAGDTLLEFSRIAADNPPVLFIQPIDMNKRFKEIRAHRSFCTILPSTRQMRAYFHREEGQRYSNPQRPFLYTAHDGQKSTVAPLIGSIWSMRAQARAHPLLKDKRPSHFTLLSLVRDAASRLPERIGTRSDIELLTRDSQYLLENVSDYQLLGAVTGAHDRLRLENDPCIRFDKDRHLWVYLHGDRKAEEF